MKTGCALVPGHTTIGPDGRYRAVYDPPLEWTPSGDKRADVARLTEDLTRVIEGWIREHPDQWLWIHRRWKTQPTASPASSPAAAPSPSLGRQL